MHKLCVPDSVPSGLVRVNRKGIAMAIFIASAVSLCAEIEMETGLLVYSVTMDGMKYGDHDNEYVTGEVFRDCDYDKDKALELLRVLLECLKGDDLGYGFECQWFSVDERRGQWIVNPDGVYAGFREVA